MKTSELTGAQLDWAVAKCEGPNSVASCYYDDDAPLWLDEAPENEWTPSTNWVQGGPIIEREFISLADTTSLPLRWVASLMHEDKEYDGYVLAEEHGPTPLIAAMRCYVASKLGSEVEIPKELS